MSINLVDPNPTTHQLRDTSGRWIYSILWIPSDRLYTIYPPILLSLSSGPLGLSLLLYLEVTGSYRSSHLANVFALLLPFQDSAFDRVPDAI